MQSAEYYRQKAAELRKEAAAASTPRIKDQLKRIMKPSSISLILPGGQPSKKSAIEIDPAGCAVPDLLMQTPLPLLLASLISCFQGQ
jgi:hypothetical protein